MEYEKWFQKLEADGLLVNSIHSLGWGFWPAPNFGYMDEVLLRALADEIEKRNKPFWDEYEEYCKQSQLRDEEEVSKDLMNG